MGIIISAIVGIFECIGGAILAVFEIIAGAIECVFGGASPLPFSPSEADELCSPPPSSSLPLQRYSL
ncbi:uncharacterized protein PHACADRAFT_200049 [Phanerochaete carnosa HHB-10118-sp]|uniref:Uncharacterized protein n=1 Tax=Phanerochaete carnosa (strain HHB-10118-sp) TaxID=650164 RepID=K5UNB2_PHACS|nr:uncharacterized protein PHACADRAFT_200049 [Phanerochaete carnosa HHB-10118-sp]EKM51226.1 hypothetical protein PHACADRAFT_200049 [Phanerochaete carnosa HHB-10118-sp]